ncbi:MAG: cupin domain-containing protein [Treponema phagedenis]|uniref:cupin domain-containing protein n=1 Tax=Treponema phagedenis TaxID=162 RepID=UPI0011E72CA6|nr:cupin domain-containing protein [Treponema phagedenis]QEJ94361.1 cupin domain-containing protein [Treponema phagedenis]
MVITKSEMTTRVQNELKGGKGEVRIIDYFKNDLVPNCKLFSEMTIPAGGSIGEHTHLNETEVYVIRSGSAIVTDNGKDLPAVAGDIVVTGHNQSHSIRNAGDTPLIITAVIVTE